MITRDDGMEQPVFGAAVQDTNLMIHDMAAKPIFRIEKFPRKQ